MGHLGCDVVRWYHQHDVGACGNGGGDGVVDDALLADGLVLLESTEPSTATAGDHDRPDVPGLGKGHGDAG